MRWSTRLAVVPMLLLGLASFTHAAVVTWVGDAADPGGVTAQKPWVSAFWSTGAPPAGGTGPGSFTGDDARVNNGGHVLIDDTQNIGLPAPNPGAYSGTGFMVMGSGTAAGTNNGYIDMTGGTMVTAFDVRIGGDAAGTVGNGTFNQSGGILNMNGGNLNVGFGVNANGLHSVGVMNLSGGSFTLRSGIIIAVGNRGNGTVNQSGGDMYLMALNNANVNNSVLQLGRVSATATKSSSGTYNLNGGRVVAANTQFGNGSPITGSPLPNDATPTSAPTDGPSINTFSLSGTGLLITDNINIYNHFSDGDPNPLTSKSTVNTFNMTGGTLTAKTIGIPLTNDGGTLAPATVDFTPGGIPENIDDFLAARFQPVGSTTFSGTNSYTQTANGTLAIDLVSQNSYDQLVVNSGTATLDGTLALTVHNGFVGNTGDNYQVVVGGTLGTFATVTGNDLGGGLKLNKTTDITGIYLLVALPGDADLNKTADFIDLGMLLNNYDNAGGWSSGDFDDSQVVDFIDLGILLNNFNQSVPMLTTAAPVPEPSTLVLAAVGLCGVGLARRRRLRA